MGMITRTKVLLVLGIAGLVAGLVVSTNLVPPPFAAVSYVLLPVGAIFFGLFLVSRILEQESVFFDQEQAAAVKSAEDRAATGGPASASTAPK